VIDKVLLRSRVEGRTAVVTAVLRIVAGVIFIAFALPKVLAA
jgi:hypothetical protein